MQFGVIETEQNGRIIEYREKPNLDYLVSMGIYLFAPLVREYIPRGQKYDFSDLVQKLIGANKTALGYESDAYWIDIGRPDDCEKANREFP